jgi:tetrahydromethanopterin S-methyltransferase subunit C
MRLLSSCEIERTGGGDAYCDIEVGLWGTGLGVATGIALGAVNPLLGIAVGGLMAGTAMAFGPDALCRDRETDYDRFPYVN